MIAQLQAAPVGPNATGLGQPSPEGAAQGFAALMQGMAGQGAAPEPQVREAKTAPSETDSEADALPEGIDLETAEGLLALMDHTIAGLKETNSQVTPKAALAAFAEALGEALPEEVGALEAVAQLDDPTLEAALEEKLAGALRIPTPTSQLSIASAVLPVVGRMAMATGQAQQGPVFETADRAAPVLQTEGNVEQGTVKPVNSDAMPILRQTNAGTTEAPLAAQVEAGTTSAAKVEAGVPSAVKVEAGATSAAKVDAGTTSAAKVEAGTTAPAKVELSAEAADPRITPTTDRFSAVFDAIKPAQPGANAPASEAVLREVAALTAPQAPQSEALRLSAPQPMPAPAPNPAAAPEEQLRQHVSQQIRSLDTGDNKLRFSLSPYGMGEIEIEVVRNEAGRMQIAMTTESASVLNLLRQDREQLLDALQSRGISAENADLDFQTFDDRGRNGGQHVDPTFTQNLSEGDDTEGLDAQPLAPTSSSSLIAGQLDILT